MDDPAIRPYTPADRDAIVPLLRDLQAHLVPLFDRMKPVDDMGPWYLDALLERCVEEHGQVIVADVGGALVGYAVVLCRVSSEPEIDEVPHTYALVADLDVRAGWRGRGIGRALLAECERIARADGARWLRVCSLAANTGARRVYEAWGFHEHLIEYEKPLKA